MSFIKITIKSPMKRSHIKKIPISKTTQIKTSVHITYIYIYISKITLAERKTIIRTKSIRPEKLY